MGGSTHACYCSAVEDTETVLEGFNHGLPRDRLGAKQKQK